MFVWCRRRSFDWLYAKCFPVRMDGEPMAFWLSETGGAVMKPQDVKHTFPSFVRRLFFKWEQAWCEVPTTPHPAFYPGCSTVWSEMFHKLTKTPTQQRSRQTAGDSWTKERISTKNLIHWGQVYHYIPLWLQNKPTLFLTQQWVWFHTGFTTSQNKYIPSFLRKHHVLLVQYKQLWDRTSNVYMLWSHIVEGWYIRGRSTVVLLCVPLKT